MNVDKVIIKSILTTLTSILLLFAFMITTLIFVFPQTMMTLSYDLGMESASIHFAEVAYKRRESVYYIAYATEVAIDCEDDEKIVACGEELIADEGFADYCKTRDASVSGETAAMSYKQYVYGRVCVSMYKRGDKAQAVERAFELVKGGFSQNNAVVAVMIAAFSENDTATLKDVKGKMEQMQKDGFAEEDNSYYGLILAALESKTNG